METLIDRPDTFKRRAEQGARVLREYHGFPEMKDGIGIILGTGWGTVFELQDEKRVPLNNERLDNSFKHLLDIPGYARAICCGTIPVPGMDGRPVVVQRGRVHMNETYRNPDAEVAVRLQVEQLLALGVKTLILTASVGSLVSAIEVGNVVVIDAFASVFEPEQPNFGGEFRSPEDLLTPDLRRLARQVPQGSDLVTRDAEHVMVRGPTFEGRKLDKSFLRMTGATVVGMSILPEVRVVSVYDDVRVLALGFVTNTAVEAHSHEENQRRAVDCSGKLNSYLRHLIANIVRADAKVV